MPVSPERDHMRRPASASVMLVEYGDYECPYCRAAHPVVNAIRTQLQSRLSFVFRHFPLTTVHPHAQAAAEAAEAAGSQHKFWQMHDTLFATDAPLPSNPFTAPAAAPALPMSSFPPHPPPHLHLPLIRN